MLQNKPRIDTFLIPSPQTSSLTYKGLKKNTSHSLIAKNLPEVFIPSNIYKNRVRHFRYQNFFDGQKIGSHREVPLNSKPR